MITNYPFRCKDSLDILFFATFFANMCIITLELTHSVLKSPDKGDLGGLNTEITDFLRLNVRYFLNLRKS